MSVKKIGFITACSLVVANMVGTGVFTSLGFQVGPLPSFPVLIFLWICGGIMALCGGLSYIKLARLYPGSGGEYHYLRENYPKGFSHLIGFITIFAGFSAPVALAAMACCRYFAQISQQLPLKLAAVLLITAITLVHCLSLRISAKFQVYTTLLKVILLVVFIGFGLFTNAQGTPFVLSTNDLDLVYSAGFGTSLIYVSFAYSGWNACVYIFHEIDKPGRNIQFAIILGTCFVTLLYVLLNYVFLKVVPLKELEGVVEVGAVVSQRLFGHSGGEMIAALISVLLVSSISALIWTGSRVLSTMISGTLGITARNNAKGIPLPSIIIQYVITIILVISNTFEQILMFSSALLILSSSLAVAILFKDYKRLNKIDLLPAAIFLIGNMYALIVLIF